MNAMGGYGIRWTRADVLGCVLAGLAAALGGCGQEESPVAPPADASPVSSGASPAIPRAKGTISGIVTLAGARPKRTELQIDEECRDHHKGEPLLSDQVIVNGEGALRFAFVYVADPPPAGYPVPEEPAVLIQQGCRYVPHVLGYRAGQPLRVVNSDPFTHNVRSFAKTNRAFNMGQPAESKPRIKTYRKPEMAVKLKCDVHRWMQGYMFVMEHPFFAVTDENGAFEIPDLPGGEYTLVAWHEKYGEQELALTVDGPDSTIRFEFQHPSR